MRKRIYQVNIGGYDENWHKNKSFKGASYNYIDHIEKSTGDPKQDSRIAKFNPPFPIEEGRVTLYIDGAFEIIEDSVSDWMEDQIQDYDIVFTASFTSADYFEEGRKLLLMGIGDQNILNKQLKDYKSEGVKESCNHPQGGIFIFRDSQAVRNLLKKWEEEYRKYPSRDQLALHKVLMCPKNELNWGWMNPYSVVKFPLMETQRKFHFTYHQHLFTERPKINFVIGWDTNKKIGKSLNRQIERIPDDEWVCVMDGDIMFLIDHWGKMLEDAIINNPNTEIFSCMTNRLGLEYQLSQGFSDEYSVQIHKSIAEDQAAHHWYDYEHINKPVAGMMQLFRKSYWNNNHYQEDIVTREGMFDWTFCQKAVQQNKQITLIKGLYVFHAYRVGLSEARRQIGHLI